jgi:hypothetical protein
MRTTGGGSGGGTRQSLEQQIERGEEIPLETVLNDSDILNECKWGNQKIIK